MAHVKLKHMVWTTLWMVFAPSSACSVRHLGLAIEIVKGDHLDSTNPFHWSKVVLNLPVSACFDQSMPWVCELNTIVNKITGECFTLLDEIRVLGLSVENCWQCSTKLSSSIKSLGTQDTVTLSFTQGNRK